MTALRDAARDAIGCMRLQQSIERNRKVHGAEGWTPVINALEAALAADSGPSREELVEALRELQSFAWTVQRLLDRHKPNTAKRWTQAETVAAALLARMDGVKS